MDPKDHKAIVCEYCGRDVGSWSNLVQVDGGDWQCATCRSNNLQAKKSWPGQRCDVMGCQRSAKDHIEEFRRIVSLVSWTEKFTTKRTPPVDPTPLPF